MSGVSFEARIRFRLSLGLSVTSSLGVQMCLSCSICQGGVSGEML